MVLLRRRRTTTTKMKGFVIATAMAAVAVIVLLITITTTKTNTVLLLVQGFTPPTTTTTTRTTTTRWSPSRPQPTSTTLFFVAPPQISSSSSSSSLSPPPSYYYSSSPVLAQTTTTTKNSCVVAPLKGSFFDLDGFTVSSLASSLFQYNGNVPFGQALGLNVALFTVLSQKLRKMLTPEGFAHAMALGTMLWTTLGWRGWTTCVVYLFLGQLVTKVKFQEKEASGIAEKRGGRRGPENVWGSAATALVCAACAAQGPAFLGIERNLYLLGFVASLATKLADTFASEIGKAYGKTTFLITTFERVEPGTEGAVSLEGTAAAVVGGFLLSLYGYAVVHLIDTPAALGISTFASFLACNFESLLGATIQEKDGFEWLTNEVINFINTVFGATVAIIAGKMFL